MNTSRKITRPITRPITRAITRATSRAGAAACLALSLVAQAQVGMRQGDSPAGPLTLIYPTAATERRQSLGPFEIDVALGAAPKAGNRRLIVLSHGSGGSALADFTLARRLALDGFVVAQPQHRGDNYQDQSQVGPVSWRRRPSEVSAAIDAVAAMPEFASLLDLDKVGVHGMSAGGVSGLSLAGARWNEARLLEHCRIHLDSDRNFCLFGSKSDDEARQRIAAYQRAASDAGLRTQDDDRPAVRPDARVAAVALTVPVSAIFSAESLRRIQIPVGIVTARADEVLAPQWHADHVLAHCGSCVTLARLENAGHFDVLSPWPAAVADPVARFIPGGRLNPAFKPAERDAAYASISTFFGHNLVKQDKRP